MGSEEALIDPLVVVLFPSRVMRGDSGNAGLGSRGAGRGTGTGTGGGDGSSSGNR